MRKLLLLMNPFAGQRRANRYLTDIITIFNEGGYEARTSSYTGAVADDLCNGQLSLLRSLKTSGK